MAGTLEPGPDGAGGNMRSVTRTALITGGTGGLGVAVVATFLDAGWRVIVPYVAGGGPERLPDGAEPVEADLTDPDDAARAVRVAAADGDAPLRAVANLVGGFRAGQPVAETPIADFEAMFTLNVRPAYLVTQSALPRLAAAGGGAIVCVSSRSALEPFAGGAGYAASKAAVTAFARTVAREGASHGVRCNVIVPSMIDTPKDRAASPEAVDKMVPPERIARTIRFLCDDDSSALNGVAIPV
jgi:NAD(P)-dependent dehydrogenase (short-subunit alcohol dehydrogenase family)